MCGGEFQRSSFRAWVVNLPSAVFIAATFLAAPCVMAVGPTVTGGYRIGLNFLDAPHESPYVGWINGSGQPDNTYSPVLITAPGSNAVTDGGLAGWTEAAARRAVTLAVEDAYRAVDTGNAGRTLAIAIYGGPIAAAGAGRRLNA